MAYTLSYTWYCKKIGLCTESKEKAFGDIDSLKEELILPAMQWRLRSLLGRA